MEGYEEHRNRYHVMQLDIAALFGGGTDCVNLVEEMERVLREDFREQFPEDYEEESQLIKKHVPRGKQGQQ